MTFLAMAILTITLFSGCTQKTNQGLNIVLVGRSPHQEQEIISTQQL